MALLQVRVASPAICHESRAAGGRDNQRNVENTKPSFSSLYIQEVNVMGLMRSRSDKMIAGVCGGIARTLGWDPTLVRVVYVVASIFSAAFPGILVYIILWAIM